MPRRAHAGLRRSGACPPPDSGVSHSGPTRSDREDFRARVISMMVCRSVGLRVVSSIPGRRYTIQIARGYVAALHAPRTINGMHPLRIMSHLPDEHIAPTDTRTEPVAAVAGEDLERYLQALIAGDSTSCAHLVDKALAAGIPVPGVYEGLMKPALYRIGELWARNQVSVACEHLATTITEGLLNRVYPSIVHARHCGRKVVLATVEDELHQVGLKMVGDLFEMHGWDARLMLAGASIDCLLESIERERPDVVGLSFSVDFHVDALKGMLRRIRAAYPELPILIGGQGLAHGGHGGLDAEPGVTCIASLDALSRLLQSEPPWTCETAEQTS
ncbi:MAG: hypothetical protein EOM22_12435 [Gammaproteobacteria bacterium]|nr:hypothetical protein [Gammaproteobacteria bacterium]